ncbi:hypothetical protein BST86_14000 [Nonlabens agnitus]|uniref:Uncharacterized protein n=2 Tax=Nonlabens agnitus TaxID=870484 RepID=A0A2S9WXE4_9FLAO|nr:hypothetical protein BST86_14000 [Nonlabens agnitus]
MFIRGLDTFANRDKHIEIMHKMNPDVQAQLNEERRRKHYAKRQPADQREIFFFGSHKQVTITAPDYKRALKYFYTISHDLRREGGIFKYSPVGHSTNK